MSKKPLGEQLFDAIAEYILIFVVLCALGIPIAFLNDGLTGAAGLIFIVVIFAICMLSGSEEKSAKSYSSHKNEPSNNMMGNENKNGLNDYKGFKYPPVHGYNFCPSCGRRIKNSEEFCPKCYPKNKSKIKICPKCGNELDTNRGRCPYCNHFFGAKKS